MKNLFGLFFWQNLCDFWRGYNILDLSWIKYVNLILKTLFMVQIIAHLQVSTKTTSNVGAIDSCMYLHTMGVLCCIHCQPFVAADALGNRCCAAG